MLLSEAIRLGAMLAPQAFDEFQNENTQATCAIAGAKQALGDEEWASKFADHYSVRCPVCGQDSDHLLSGIAHLNDQHRWSRTAIADWVEALEAKRGVQDSNASSKQTHA